MFPEYVGLEFELSLRRALRELIAALRGLVPA